MSSRPVPSVFRPSAVVPRTAFERGGGVREAAHEPEGRPLEPMAKAPLVMEPVLYFRGATDHVWRLAVLLGAPPGAMPPALEREDAPPLRPVRLARLERLTLWRYDFELPVGIEPRARTFRLGAAARTVHLPGRGEAIRIAFTACNGVAFEDEAGVGPERNERWRHLAAEHERAPFHLLLQGGDQLYADSIWKAVPELDAWQRMMAPDRSAAEVPDGLRARIFDYYVERYVGVWSQPELAPLLGGIPSLMMWDDHDIFDGWGSYEPEEQACPVYQAIWQGARDSFALFQLALRQGEVAPGVAEGSTGHFGWAYKVGDLGLIAPDLRSERTIDRVMGDAGQAWFERALEGMAGCRRVLVLATVPIVHADLRLVEGLSHLERPFAWLSALLHNLQDDMRDQWRAVRHYDEWQRLVLHLAGFVRRTDTPLTILSGEIHLGAFGTIRATGLEIAQLTSSGIVSHPPPRFVARLLDWLALKRAQIRPELEVALHRFPGLKTRFLRRRNWLELEVAADGGANATWHAEGRAEPFRLVLPVQS